jgi:hypothetical protein
MFSSTARRSPPIAAQVKILSLIAKALLALRSSYLFTGGIEKILDPGFDYIASTALFKTAFCLSVCLRRRELIKFPYAPGSSAFTPRTDALVVFLGKLKTSLSDG